jgi:predicted NBD/HSP70 family sugar kinase
LTNYWCDVLNASHAKPILRQLSAGSVMDAIIHHGPISRARIARLTHISKQTASEVVRELEAAGWIRVHGQARGAIGRTALTYEIRPDAAYVAGIDLGGTQLRMAIVNLASAVVAEAFEATTPAGGHAVVEQIASVGARLAHEAGIDRNFIRLVVVGTPGVLDVGTGSIKLAPNIPDFDKIDVVGLLRDTLGSDVIIENDVNVGAIGERWLGRARGLDTFGYIALGTGLGMGIVSNGEIRMADDDAARRAIDETTRLLALAVVSVAATIDPQMVVFGGSIGGRAELVEAVRKHLALLMTTPVEVAAGELGQRAGLAGALAIGINNIHNALFAPSVSPRLLSLPAIAGMRGLGFAS